MMLHSICENPFTGLFGRVQRRPDSQPSYGELDTQGIGSAYCLPVLGPICSGFVESARAADTIVIDGCPVVCGRKLLKNTALNEQRHFVVTEAGIDKSNNFDNLDSETKQALGWIMTNI